MDGCVEILPAFGHFTILVTPSGIGSLQPRACLLIADAGWSVAIATPLGLRITGPGFGDDWIVSRTGSSMLVGDRVTGDALPPLA